MGYAGWEPEDVEKLAWKMEEDEQRRLKEEEKKEGEKGEGKEE